MNGPSEDPWTTLGRPSDKTKCVSNDRSGHDDSNGPRIVKIGAILAIFRPFEISRKVSVGQALSKSSTRIQNIDAHMFGRVGVLVAFVLNAGEARYEMYT